MQNGRKSRKKRTVKPELYVKVTLQEWQTINHALKMLEERYRSSEMHESADMVAVVNEDWGQLLLNL